MKKKSDKKRKWKRSDLVCVKIYDQCLQIMCKLKWARI